MLNRRELIKRLVKADSNARQELSKWKDSEHPDPSRFAESIYRYVIFKFLLDDDEDLSPTHDLNELAKQSVIKAGKLNPNETTLLDASKHCGAASSFMTKKVLLFMSLSEYFGFQYPPYNTADIESTDMLAEIILKKCY